MFRVALHDTTGDDTAGFLQERWIFGVVRSLGDDAALAGGREDGIDEVCLADNVVVSDEQAAFAIEEPTGALVAGRSDDPGNGVEGVAVDAGAGARFVGGGTGN